MFVKNDKSVVIKLIDSVPLHFVILYITKD